MNDILVLAWKYLKKHLLWRQMHLESPLEFSYPKKAPHFLYQENMSSNVDNFGLCEWQVNNHYIHKK